MHRLQWAGFKSWLVRNGHQINYVNLTEVVDDIRKQFKEEKFNKLLSMPDFLVLFSLYNEYCKENNGPLKVFWNSYLEMVELVMNFVRATREGNWDLHLESIKNMLPWFFAYDHINYARYLPVYLAHMLLLQDTHPEAHALLTNGEFGVQRTTSHGFSQLPVDQTIEQTLNRSTKTKGGIVGFSLRKGAVQRWMLTAHSRAAFVDKCRSMTKGIQEDQRSLHKEIGSARMTRDEEDVKKVVEVLSNWRNPFGPSEELTSLSSGYVASESMKRDLLMAKEKGTTALTSFVEERLVTTATGFFETLPKLKLGSFRDACKKSSLTVGDKNVVIRSDRNLFARLLVIGQSRHMDLRELLIHELGPLPWSLASCDGSLAKTNKAALSKLLEDGVECLPSLPDQTTAVIMDAMAVLQTLVRVPDKFSELAEMVMTIILAEAGEATRIDFVGDQYPPISIKNAERNKRGRDGQLVINITSPQQFCPRQWRKFMANGSNKTGLLNFLVREWSANPVYTQKIKDHTLFVAHGGICTKLEVSLDTISASTVLDLCSNQEEADTRMFLHADHASRNGHQHIAIKSSDTDVEVLACYYQAFIPAEMTLISGTRNRSRIVSIPHVCAKLGPEICQVLPSLHAMTGCDSVSAFSSKGKKKALGIVQSNPGLRRVVSNLGECVPAEVQDLNMLEQFVCALYNGPKCNDVNELRYRLFCKSKNLQSHQLPPTKAALENHLKRANYQAFIWKHALEPNMDQAPDGQGWQQKGDQLEIYWTDQAPAPDAVMKLVCCGCKGSCATRRCSCVSNGLRCTEACACQDSCMNCANEEENEEDDESDDDDNDDDDDDNVGDGDGDDES